MCVLCVPLQRAGLAGKDILSDTMLTNAIEHGISIRVDSEPDTVAEVDNAA